MEVYENWKCLVISILKKNYVVKKFIWNNIKVSKQWQYFHLRMDYPIKDHLKDHRYYNGAFVLLWNIKET